jgi:UDP-N-acetyl-D-mannosaminuronic acid dehydrogenase
VGGLELIRLARRINEGMPLHMAHLVKEALAEAGRPLAGARVAVLGVAYLEDSDDTRNTPAVPLIRALLERGAEVIAHDPYVREREWQLAWDGGGPAPLVQELGTALRDADCTVVVTRHREYVELAESGRQQVVSGESQRSQGNPEELKASALLWMKRLMRKPILVDGRNVFEAEACRAAGMIYRGVGKG